MAEKTYALEEYNHSFDAGLAEMWNESDDEWPGTFTDGVPMTEARVQEWMDRLDAIIRFVVIEDQTGKVVGYGDLWDTPVRPNSCYVALLNVHPDHQGRSLARRMLVRMVDWCVENDYDRITIATWPANLKAMPLYKKVGFFWKPDTSVFMENYLPAARLLPAAQSFFDQHDWYTTYDRELEQVEDSMRHSCVGDTPVYILRWRANGNMLETVFDRNTHSLTGLETDDWAAYARTSEHEPAQGLPYGFEWEFYNKLDRAITISLQAKGDPGIALQKKIVFELQPRKSNLIRSDFTIDLDAPKYLGHHEDVPTPRVKTQLEIDGQPVELGTGLRYRPAVAFSLNPQLVTLQPGIPGRVHVQIQNRARKKLKGLIQLDLPEGLQSSWKAHPFEIPEEGYAGETVEIKAEKPGFFALRTSALIEAASIELETRPKSFDILAPGTGSWAAGEGEEELIMENDFFRIVAREKSGEAEIWNKDTGKKDALLMEEIGPAFVPWDLHEQQYQLHLKTDARNARAIMTVRSTRFPGVVVGREITMNASPIIKVNGWVTNNSDARLENLKLRPHVRIWSENRRQITVPLLERTVRENGSQFGISDEDFPKKKDRYREQWAAYDHEARTIGFAWSDSDLDHIDAEWGRHFLYFDLPKLAPGETAHIRPLWLYAGPGDWRAVQQMWQRQKGQQTNLLKGLEHKEAQNYLDFGLTPDPLISMGQKVETTLQISSTRQYPLEGALSIEPPVGWQIDPANTVFKLDLGHPVADRVVLQPTNESGPGAIQGKLCFESQLFDREKPFTLIQLGDLNENVKLEKSEWKDHEIWAIANGHSRWEIAGDFHGGVIAWYAGRSRQNHLNTSFPSEGEYGWMKPFLGGIRPVLHTADYEDGWPGKLHEEHFEIEAYQECDDRGLRWSGVRVSAELKKKKDFRGMRVALDYLTLPGSNVLKTVYQIHNETSIYRAVQHGWLTYLDVDGGSDKAVLHTPDYIRKRTPHSTWGINKHWTAVENPASGRAVVAIHANGHRRIQSVDMGVLGAFVFVRQSVNVPPAGTAKRVAYFALANSVAQAAGYDALAKL